MTQTQTETRPAPGTRLRGLSSGVILVFGVMVVPAALVMMTTSYDAPDAQAYVRVAFAQVVGATIAIGTVIGLVVQRILRRSPVRDISWFAFIAIIITASQISFMSSAADTLVARLGS
jgi:hypothetical protein